jgi:hypothetical protein
MVLPATLPTGQPPLPEPPPRGEAKRWALGLVGAVAAMAVLVIVVRAALGAFGGGSYAFLQTQGDDPVTWDHCQAIRYQVNPKGAPEGWQDIVTKAVQDIEDASGFVFMDLGTTSKTQLIGHRYDGNAWEPVLILWSDRYQDGALDGRVIGLGGGGTVDVGGRLRYVVGKISLDSDLRDPFATRMTLEHELGHVLGLDHVDDVDELMNAEYVGQTGFGPGDREGLKRLHDLPCA